MREVTVVGALLKPLPALPLREVASIAGLRKNSIDENVTLNCVHCLLTCAAVIELVIASEYIK